VAQLPERYEITPADLKGALQRERTEIHSGDVVLIHTRWGSLWMKDNARFGDSEPALASRRTDARR
jgi:kynurenine formamidase